MEYLLQKSEPTELCLVSLTITSHDVMSIVVHPKICSSARLWLRLLLKLGGLVFVQLGLCNSLQILSTMTPITY